MLYRKVSTSPSATLHQAHHSVLSALARSPSLHFRSSIQAQAQCRCAAGAAGGCVGRRDCRPPRGAAPLHFLGCLRLATARHSSRAASTARLGRGGGVLRADQTCVAANSASPSSWPQHSSPGIAILCRYKVPTTWSQPCRWTTADALDTRIRRCIWAPTKRKVERTHRPWHAGRSPTVI